MFFSRQLKHLFFDKQLRSRFEKCELLFAGLHFDANCIQLHITCLKNEIQDEALPITHDKIRQEMQV
jgi:hypothetical protein